MELRRYLSIARRRALLIIAIIGASLVAGWLITPRAKTYTATATLYAGSRSVDLDVRAGQVSQDRTLGFDRLITTWSTMLSTSPVATAAVERTGVDRAPGQVAAETAAKQVTGTNLISVSVTDPDPATARALANGVSRAFVSQIRGLEPRGNASSDQVVSVYDTAALPGAPNSSDLARNLALSGIFGIVIAAGVVALLEHLDISFRSSDDVERHLELPVLGVIPALGDHLPTPPAARVEAMTAHAEYGRGAQVG